MVNKNRFLLIIVDYLGYSGTNCELAGFSGRCSTYLCQNGGVCDERHLGSSIFSYCQCSPGFTGQRCETRQSFSILILHLSLFSLQVTTPALTRDYSLISLIANMVDISNVLIQ